ncbi:MAG: cytochrome c [Epsilonproteobacteria bacterium]|nr:cytochrome c [Campylobacterota bacterium]
MSRKKVSVWSDNRFWQRSAIWVTGFASLLLIWLTFDTMGQISMGNQKDIDNHITKRVPSATVINYEVEYNMNQNRGHEVPVIGGDDGKGNSLFKVKEKFFGRDDYTQKEANALLHLGKLASQAKNCMDCHTLLGNGAYYAPDLTKAWLDPAWGKNGPMQAMTGKNTKEEAMAEFLQHPGKYPTHARMMPNLGITPKEAIGLVAFLKHMSTIDTNGFPRGFGKIKEGVVYAKSK